MKPHKETQLPFQRNPETEVTLLDNEEKTVLYDPTHRSVYSPTRIIFTLAPMINSTFAALVKHKDKVLSHISVYAAGHQNERFLPINNRREQSLLTAQTHTTIQRLRDQLHEADPSLKNSIESVHSSGWLFTSRSKPEERTRHK
jgi:hypothetical protein